MLKQFVLFFRFRNGRLSQLKHLIQERDWMCKLDLKDRYFSIPLDQDSRKFVSSRQKGTFCEFMCLCFGLGLVPRVFTKLLKIPALLLRKINIRVMTYLDNMQILTHMVQEAQNFGLYNKYKEINFAPMPKNRFPGNGDRFNHKLFCH